MSLESEMVDESSVIDEELTDKGITQKVRGGGRGPGDLSRVDR